MSTVKSSSTDDALQCPRLAFRDSSTLAPNRFFISRLTPRFTPRRERRTTNPTDLVLLLWAGAVHLLMWGAVTILSLRGQGLIIWLKRLLLLLLDLKRLCRLLLLSVVQIPYDSHNVSLRSVFEFVRLVTLLYCFQEHSALRY